jgi:hypothetical protein
VAEFEVSVPSLRPARRRLLDKRNYVPWVRAEGELTDCTLFWMPVSQFPVREQEKTWIMEFLTRLSLQLSQSFDLRSEIFFQYKQITAELGDAFRRYSPKCMKLLGVGRQSESDLPVMPTPEQVKELIESGKEINVHDWIADFLIWFITKQPEEQRELFLGRGGMMTLFLPPDSKTVPPKLPVTPALRAAMPVFQKMDVDGIVAGAFAARDSFLEKSKILFGGGLETRPEYPGIPFVLPLLDSSHFFLASEELRSKWFGLFDVYVNESRMDKGVILAFQKESYEDVVLDVLESMRKDKMVYRTDTY